MKNEHALRLICELFGNAKLIGGELEDECGTEAIVQVTDQDGAVLFSRSTAQIQWAVEATTK